MKSYDSYKPSGVDWLGDIPEHWGVKRLKFVARVQSSNVDKKSFADEIPVRLCNYVDVYKHEFIDDSISFMNATATEAEIEKFILNEDDVLITKDSETPDDIANPALVVKDFKSVICGYHLAQIKPDKIELSGKYLFRLFQSPKFNSYFEVSANGITRFGLPLDSITDVLVSLPPLDEQSAIGDYLNEKTAQIDSLIKNKLRLIELLKEEHAAIINQAVTRGINPHVNLKPSSIAWLRDIPEHWEVKKLKYVANFKSGEGITSDVIQDEGEYPVYGGNGLRGYFSSFTHEGEFVLIGRQGALCGNINYAFGKFWASEHAVVATLLDRHEVAWFGEVLRTMNLNQYSQSAAQPGLAVETIKNLSIPVPSFDEQKEIVEFIKTATGTIDATIAKIEKEIGFVREYRRALISEVVTGKIKVV